MKISISTSFTREKSLLQIIYMFKKLNKILPKNLCINVILFLKKINETLVIDSFKYNKTQKKFIIEQFAKRKGLYFSQYINIPTGYKKSFTKDLQSDFMSGTSIIISHINNPPRNNVDYKTGKFLILYKVFSDDNEDCDCLLRSMICSKITPKMQNKLVEYQNAVSKIDKHLVVKLVVSITNVSTNVMI